MKMTFKSTGVLLLVAIAAFVMVGCHSTRHMQRTAPDATPATPSAPSVAEAPILPEFLQANFTCEARGITVRCQARMCRDSVIWVNATKFVDLGRALFTPTTIQVYANINNSYYACDYAEFERLSGMKVDFSTLQQMLWESTQSPTAFDVPIRTKQLTADVKVRFDTATHPLQLKFPFSIPKNARRMTSDMINF